METKIKAKLGRKKLPDEIKLRRTLTIKLDDKMYGYLNWLLEKSKGHYKSYADVFRDGIRCINWRKFAKKEEWERSLFH